MTTHARCGVWAALLCVALAATPVAASGPVARVMEIDGTVEFSRDGEGWEPVTRTKYLFSGHQVRSGSGGGATVIDQTTGDIFLLGASTTIQASDAKIAVLDGDNFGVREQARSGFWQAMRNKFATTQRYTTVRRSVRSEDDPVRLDTARSLAVGENWPELVWSNVGPEYAYRLTVGDETFTVAPSSTSEMIRFRLSAMEPGEYPYQVEIVLDGEIVYTPRRPSSLTWLSGEQEALVQAQLEEFRSDPARDDPFVIADLFEQHDLLVAALGVYREFFGEHPDENDMRPFLIKAYHDLRLLDLREKEAITYNTVEMMGSAL